MKTITVYSDPGHGWGKVSLKELKKLKIEKEISSFSFYRKGYAYLEEDRDLPIYIEVIKETKQIKYKEFYTDKRSKIRSYERYDFLK